MAANESNTRKFQKKVSDKKKAKSKAKNMKPGAAPTKLTEAFDKKKMPSKKTLTKKGVSAPINKVTSKPLADLPKKSAGVENPGKPARKPSTAKAKTGKGPKTPRPVGGGSTSKVSTSKKSSGKGAALKSAKKTRKAKTVKEKASANPTSDKRSFLSIIMDRKGKKKS